MFIVSNLLFTSVLAQTDSSVNCRIWAANIKAGDRSNEVAELQQFLIDQGFKIPAITERGKAKGYFGNQTQDAVKEFQAARGVKATGFVGSQTRSAMNRCSTATIPKPSPSVSQTPVNNSAPIISKISGPAGLSMNQVGTWTIKASDPNKQKLEYSVDWGVKRICPNGYQCMTPLDGVVYVATSTFRYQYSTAGNYKVTLAARDVEGQVTSTSSMVSVVSGQ